MTSDNRMMKRLARLTNRIGRNAEKVMLLLNDDCDENELSYLSKVEIEYEDRLVITIRGKDADEGETKE